MKDEEKDAGLLFEPVIEKQLGSLGKFIDPLNAAAASLYWSYQRCANIQKRRVSNFETEEKLDSLVSRFCRMAGLLIKTVFVLVDIPVSNNSTTFHARINYARQQGIVPGASDLILIHELRNTIMKESPFRTLQQIREDVLALAPILLAIPDSIKSYIIRFLTGDMKPGSLPGDAYLEKLTAQKSWSAGNAGISEKCNKTEKQQAKKQSDVVDIIDFHIDFSSEVSFLQSQKSETRV